MPNYNIYVLTNQELIIKIPTIKNNETITRDQNCRVRWEIGIYLQWNPYNNKTHNK